MQLKRKDQCPLSTVPRLAGDSRSVKVRTPKGCQGGGAGVAKQKKKETSQRNAHAKPRPAQRCFTALAPPLQVREAEAGQYGRYLVSLPGFYHPGRVVAPALRQLGR